MNESKYAYDPQNRPELYKTYDVVHKEIQSQRVTLGPIIGKVTDTTARVLLEFTQSGEEMLSLIASDGTSHSCYRQASANRPVVFEFHNLLPRTNYKVLSKHAFPCSSAFRTLSQGPEPTNFAFVSCNSRKSYEKYRDDNNLWGDLATRACGGEIDYIIHSGDQVYCDFYNDVYDRCVRLLKDTPKDNWYRVAEIILDLIREEYRLTLGGRLEAIALANCPNIMQFDDHEVRDDMGFRPEDIDPSTPDGYYIQLARIVYYEYQRQLREDIDFSDLSKIKTEFHSHIINNIGIFVLDYRGKNSWLQTPEKGQLGKLQWEALEQCLDPTNGDFKDCNMFILVSPLPLVFYSHGWLKYMNRAIDDLQEQWESYNMEEHVRLLSLMEAWKKAGNGTREVFAIGGDVHHGGHTDIKRNHEKVFNQLVTSGICQEKLGPHAFIVSKLAMHTSHKIHKDWTYHHHGWTSRNNYGIVNVMDPKLNSMKVQLITSGKNSKITPEKTVFYNTPDQKEGKVHHDIKHHCGF